MSKEFYYKVKRGLYYRPNNCGYTQFSEYAGVYGKQDALKEEEKSHGEVQAVKIDILEHNKNINKKIRVLKNNLIDEDCTYDHSKLELYGDPCPECGVVEGSDMK